MQGLIAWLQGLPEGALLAVMGALAAIENMFPPVPADVAVAFGGFLLARGGHSEYLAFAVVWVGNVAGAVGMFLLGRRFGADWTERRFHLRTKRVGGADARVLQWYSRYGTIAFFLSRFVPGVRSVVPPLAGALKVPLPRTAVAIAASSAIWYGLILWLAFRTGANWDALAGSVGRVGRFTAIGASALLGLGIGFWFWRRRAARLKDLVP